MSSRSNAPSDVLPPRVPPTPSGGMSLPASAVLAGTCPGGLPYPRPVVIVRAALPALALPATLLDLRTAPSGVLPRVLPSPPVGSEYWMPSAPTTSGNWSPLRSTKSTCPVLSPVAMLPPRLPTEPPTLPVSEICCERDIRGTAVASAKSPGCGRLIDSVPSRELLAVPAVTKECSPEPHRPSCGDGENGVIFGGLTRGSWPKEP